MNQTSSQPLRLSLADVSEDGHQEESEKTSFYDPSNPELAPAKPVDTSRRKGWKRKLLGWCFILLLIGGGALALYWLLRVNRVNVRVQADPRRDPSSARPNASPSNSDSGLSAEAINIARQAIGADTTSTVRTAASPGALPATSPSPVTSAGPNLSVTLHPELSPATDSGTSKSNTNSQVNDIATSQTKVGEPWASNAIAQSRANTTQSIFVDDLLPRLVIAAHSPGRPQVAQLQKHLENQTPLVAPVKTPTAVLPPFGTMLPVRTQGTIFTLRKNSYARFELTRNSQKEGWSLPKGTVFIGRTSGGEYDRAFVNVIGYIDPRENRFVKMTGEVLGSDGAAGLPGKRNVVDRNRLKETLRKIATSGLQIAGTMAGALTGRGTVVIDGAGYRLLDPVSDEATSMINGAQGKQSFVRVEAGLPAFVMVADLPKEIHAVDAPGESDINRAAISLSDREVMELILLGTPEEVRAALPLMNDEQKRLVLKLADQENGKP
jgi:hypothetical protein